MPLISVTLRWGSLIRSCCVLLVSLLFVDVVSVVLSFISVLLYSFCFSFLFSPTCRLRSLPPPFLTRSARSHALPPFTSGAGNPAAPFILSVCVCVCVCACFHRTTLRQRVSWVDAASMLISTPLRSSSARRVCCVQWDVLALARPLLAMGRWLSVSVLDVFLSFKCFFSLSHFLCLS
jgi:hypothetical protein